MPLDPGSRQEELTVKIPLYSDLLHLIEEERERMRAEDLRFTLIIGGMVRQSSPSGSYMGMTSISRRDVQLNLSLSEWKKALGLMDHQLVLLSDTVISELEDLRRKWGFWRMEDVIAKFLEFYKGEKPIISQQLLVTLFEAKTIRDKLAEATEKSANLREVRIISPYLDNTGAEYIIKMLKNRVNVKLITRKSDKKAQEDAITMLKNLGAEVKVDKMMHARVVIFDDIAAIISSADLDSEGLNNQRQMGIFTTDKVVVKDAITFFDKAWELAEKW